MSFFKRKKKSEIYFKLDNLQMNLENNYKDEAHKAMKEVQELFVQMKEKGELSSKEEEKLSKRIAEYKQKLTGYGHYENIGW